MARPTRRRGSAALQFKLRIPLDVRSKAVGKVLVVPIGDGEATIRIGPATDVIQFSLRTHDPVEAKARHAVALASLEGVWKALRDGPVRLSQKQVVAISGEVYRELVAAAEDNPGRPEGWEALYALVNRPVGSGLRIPLPGEAPPLPRPIRMSPVDKALSRRGLVVDEDSHDRLQLELKRVFGEAALRLGDNALGNYGPDLNEARFPKLKLDPRPVDEKPKIEAGSLTGLVEDWWVERKATGTAQSTYVNYSGTVRKLIQFLGHDDAARVTAQDVVRFKDKRLAEGISPRTVKDGDLAALKSVFGWAVDNLRLPNNPASGLRLKVSKPKLSRPKEFTDDEAEAILSASLALQRGGEMEKTWLAKRWVPWLLAYTGARVGEIVQLRKEDLRQEKDHWAIVITPEAGTVKGGQFRHVPLHPHLVELGFPAMVEGAPDGHLFLDPNRKTHDVIGPLQGAKNRVSEFVRQHVADHRVSPNHGWRHRFITKCREYGVSEELRGMITGHTGRDVAAREYGGPAGLYREIRKLPQFVLSAKTGAPVGTPSPTQTSSENQL